MALRRIGNWNGVERLIGNLAFEMEKARNLALKRWGLKAEALAKQHMSMQDLGWKPLKASTIAQKLRKGESDQILIATSDYFQAITSWVKDDTVMAGVKRTIRNTDGDIIADIARIHEFGAGNVPARPLWQPVFKETMDWFVKGNTHVDIFQKNIQSYL